MDLEGEGFSPLRSKSKSREEDVLKSKSKSREEGDLNSKEEDDLNSKEDADSFKQKQLI